MAPGLDAPRVPIASIFRVGACEAHGGWLGIESAEGVGTIVTLGVPVARATGEAAQANARTVV